MFMRVLAPRRPQPAPMAGTSLSVAAHAALLLASSAGGDGTAADPGGRAARRPDAPVERGERLHWVGVADGYGRRTGGRGGELPPVAYVVPGRGGVRVVAAGGPRGESARRAARAGAPAADAPRLAPDDRAALRRVVRPARLAALPAVTLPEPDATLLVAGVVTSAPDMARRVSRPEDFAPAPTARMLADLLVRTGMVTGVAGADPSLRAMPVPFVTNPTPAYPAALAAGHVGGRVVVEFRVDTAGAVELASLQVVQSTDARFTEAVRTVLPQLRFVPAQLGERAVAVTVRQPFLFTFRSGAAAGL